MGLRVPLWFYDMGEQSFVLGDGPMPKGSSTIQPGKVPRNDYVMSW
jgi:hypothetical protein